MHAHDTSALRRASVIQLRSRCCRLSIPPAWLESADLTTIGWAALRARAGCTRGREDQLRGVSVLLACTAELRIGDRVLAPTPRQRPGTGFQCRAEPDLARHAHPQLAVIAVSRRGNQCADGSVHATVPRTGARCKPEGPKRCRRQVNAAVLLTQRPPPVRRLPRPSGNEEDSPSWGFWCRAVGCGAARRARTKNRPDGHSRRSTRSGSSPQADPSRDAGACSQPRLPVYRIYHELPCARCSIAV